MELQEGIAIAKIWQSKKRWRTCLGGSINEIDMQTKQKTQHLMEVVEVERRTAAVTVKERSDGADESIPSGGPDWAASRCMVPLQSTVGTSQMVLQERR